MERTQTGNKTADTARRAQDAYAEIKRGEPCCKSCEISVLAPGAKVYCDPQHDIEGVVLQISIAVKAHIQYQVEWWDGRMRRIEWFDAETVEPRDSEPSRLSIGFKRI